MIYKKRGGQATLFIILALFILMIGGLFFYFSSEKMEEEEKVMPELVPVSDYVKSCISFVTEEGLNVLGANGGYIEFPAYIANNPRAYLAGPIDDFKRPYWWYDGTSAVPSLDFMKAQLEDYVENNLGACLRDFEVFKGQYNVYEKGKADAEIMFGEEDVEVKVNYPLHVYYDMNKTRLEIENYRQVVPIRFKKIFKIAKSIMERENKDYFFERKTIDMMSMDREIPTTDIEASCGEKSWNLIGVQNRLKRSLASNIAFVRIKGAEYDENTYVPTPDGKNTYEDSYFQSHYVWEIQPEAYDSGISASFTFNENWPFYMDARPRDGNRLISRGIQGSEILSWFCLHIWHFTYDVSYPVMASVFDKAGEGHKEFRFNFLFKVNVDHNQPKRDIMSYLTFNNEDILTQEEYCNDLTEELEVHTMSADNFALDDVELTLTCGYYTCDLGKSGYMSNGAAAGITKKVPYCVNAILKGKKEGYKDTELFVNTGRPKIYNLNMIPLAEFENYKVYKHPVLAPEDSEQLKDTEKASILIKALDTDFQSFGVYPLKEGGEPIKLLGDKEHKYEVSIFLVDGDEVAGAYKANWTIGGKVLDGDEIIFHVLDMGFTTEQEKADFYDKIWEDSGKIPKPEIR